MIPRISKGGRSFKGAYLYFGHDKQQTTKERVAWTQTENMMTEDPDWAWKMMAYTVRVRERLKEAAGQKATGRPLEKPVFTYALAWHPEQNPDREHKLETARKSLAALGLSAHEALIIAHNDEPQKHVHIIVNRVHPRTGLAASLSHSKRKLSEFALMYEKEHGKIYCEQREENHQKRQEGKKARYCDLNIRDAWQSADNGQSFADALKEKGYQLAQGNRRSVVVVDPHGKIHNPARHLEGVKERDIRARLGPELIAKLPPADEYARNLQQTQRAAYFNRLAQTKTAGEAPTNEQAVPPAPRQVDDAPARSNDRGAAQPSAPEATAPQIKPAQIPEIPQPARAAGEAGQPPPVALPEKGKLAEAFGQANPFTPTPEMLNRLQTQHLEEREAESKRHERRIALESQRLADQYRIEEQKRTLAALQQKVENPSWFRRLVGLAHHDREEFAALQQTYENARSRMEERVRFLEKDRERVMAALAERHGEEKKLLLEHGQSALKEYRTQYQQKQRDQQRGLSR